VSLKDYTKRVIFPLRFTRTY